MYLHVEKSVLSVSIINSKYRQIRHFFSHTLTGLITTLGESCWCLFVLDSPVPLSSLLKYISHLSNLE